MKAIIVWKNGIETEETVGDPPPRYLTADKIKEIPSIPEHIEGTIHMVDTYVKYVRLIEVLDGIAHYKED